MTESIIEDEQRAIVDFSGVKREVGLSLLSDVNVGDYVIVHAGFAIQILDESAAKETLALLEEMTKLL